MNARIDYEALGFVLTVDDAAEVLERTRAQTLDLIRVHDLTAVLAWDEFAGAMGFRLHPQEVAGARAEREQDRVTANRTVWALAQEAIRDYLAAVPPVVDYDRALLLGAPLWSSSKKGRALNLRVEAVEKHRNSTHSHMPITLSGLESALERMGAVRVRGLVPAATVGGKQRWGKWWRVPTSLLNSESEPTLVDELIDLAGDATGRVSVRGRGEPYLTETLGND